MLDVPQILQVVLRQLAADGRHVGDALAHDCAQVVNAAVALDAVGFAAADRDTRAAAEVVAGTRGLVTPETLRL